MIKTIREPYKKPSRYFISEEILIEVSSSIDYIDIDSVVKSFTYPTYNNIAKDIYTGKSGEFSDETCELSDQVDNLSDQVDNLYSKYKVLNML